MREAEVSIPSAGVDLTATWSKPADQCRAGLVLLHPSGDGSRRQFLFQDLATRLPRLSVSVLRYDRRPKDGGADVPYELQVDDLQHALDWYRQQLGRVPIGLWGFSQGAWVAMMAAAVDPSITFLILVGGSAVSPAQQMRYGTSEQLRRAGYGPTELAELARVRATWEQWQRGLLPRDRAQAVIDEAADCPWFKLSWVPTVLPDHPNWVDMDFDPGDTIGRIRSPVLVFYGDDEWTPVADSIDVWQKRIADPRQLTVHHLPGAGHHPTLHNGRSLNSISPDYVSTLNSWLADRLS